MSCRLNWEDATNNFSRINLKWSQGNLSINYSALDYAQEEFHLLVNHFEYNREICNKAYLLENMQNYYYV